jgi:hypothetical protein
MCVLSGRACVSFFFFCIQEVLRIASIWVSHDPKKFFSLSSCYYYSFPLRYYYISFYVYKCMYAWMYEWLCMYVTSPMWCLFNNIFFLFSSFIPLSASFYSSLVLRYEIKIILNKKKIIIIPPMPLYKKAGKWWKKIVFVPFLFIQFK